MDAGNRAGNALEDDRKVRSKIPDFLVDRLSFRWEISRILSDYHAANVSMGQLFFHV